MPQQVSKLQITLSEDDKQFIKEQLHDYRNKKAGEADMTQQITTGKHDFLTSTNTTQDLSDIHLTQTITADKTSTKTTLDFTDMDLTQQTWTDKLQYTPTKAFNFTTLTDNGPQTLSTMTSTNTFPTFTTVTPQTTDKWLTKFNGLHTATSTYTQQTSTPQTDVTLTQTNLPAPNWTDITADIIFKKIEEVNSKVDMIMSFWGATKQEKNKTKQSKKQFERKEALPPSCDAVVEMPPSDAVGENDEYIIPDEIKRRMLNISSSRGNFAKNLVCTILNRDEREGRNCTRKSSSDSGAVMQPLNPKKLTAVKKFVYQCTGSHPIHRRRFGETIA